MAKFNFKKVKGQRFYKKWANYEVGDYVVGKLIEIGEDQYKNPNYILEVIETSLEKDDKDNSIEEGKNLCLNSNGALNYKMEDVEIGTVIRVEYEGETLLEKGPFKGKMCHTVSLEVADGGEMAVEEADLPEEDASGEDYEL